jgi:hypothetical protein
MLDGPRRRGLRHPLDRSAAQALGKLRGFDRAVAKLMEWQGERAAYVDLASSGIRVTSRQLPGLHHILHNACGVLDMRVPEMYVRPGPLNAYTAGHNNPYLVLTTDLVENLTDSAPDTKPEKPELTGSLPFRACLWCLPLSMYAVHLAGQIDARAARGDTSGAAEASAKALRWANIAIRLGIGLHPARLPSGHPNAGEPVFQDGDPGGQVSRR